MAVVYLARELSSGQIVAVKLLCATPGAGPDAAERFAREARTVAALEHPNIVRVLRVEELDGAPPAIVSVYIPGETLRDLLQRTGPLPYERAAQILREVASALAHAHGRRIMHRDVKPDNIVIETNTGRALLADFGVARPIETDTVLTVVGSAVGTPTYMAPEQVDGRTVDERADVYALGLVGWEMLTGRRPWEGETLYHVLHKQQHEQLPPLDELRPDIPTFLLRAIEGAIAKEPERRWRDGASLLARLSPTPATLPPPRTVTPPPAPSPVPVVATPSAAAANASAPAAPRFESERTPEPATPEEPASPIVVRYPSQTTAPAAEPTVPTRDARDDEWARPAAAAAAELPHATPAAPVPHPAPVAAMEPVSLSDAPDRAAVPERPLVAATDGSAHRAFTSTRRPAALRRWWPIAAALVALLFIAGFVATRERGDRTVSGDRSLDSALTAATNGDAVVLVDSGERATPTTTAAPTPTRTTPRNTAAAAPRPATGQRVEAAGTVDRLASGDPCRSAASDAQRTCLLGAIARNDAALNRTYNALIANIRARGGSAADVERLRVEQRAWIAERDRTCRSAASNAVAMWGVARAPCFAEQSTRRAQQLQARMRR